MLKFKDFIPERADKKIKDTEETVSRGTETIRKNKDRQMALKHGTENKAEKKMLKAVKKTGDDTKERIQQRKRELTAMKANKQ